MVICSAICFELLSGDDQEKTGKIIENRLILRNDLALLVLSHPLVLLTRLTQVNYKVRERIYTNNDNVRQYLVSWIQLLCSVPDIDLVSHLPMLLDGLFIILGDQKDEIRAMTQQVL